MIWFFWALIPVVAAFRTDKLPNVTTKNDSEIEFLNFESPPFKYINVFESTVSIPSFKIVEDIMFLNEAEVCRAKYPNINSTTFFNHLYCSLILERYSTSTGISCNMTEPLVKKIQKRLSDFIVFQNLIETNVTCEKSDFRSNRSKRNLLGDPDLQPDDGLISEKPKKDLSYVFLGASRFPVTTDLQKRMYPVPKYLDPLKKRLENSGNETETVLEKTTDNTVKNTTDNNAKNTTATTLKSSTSHDTKKPTTEAPKVRTASTLKKTTASTSKKTTATTSKKTTASTSKKTTVKSSKNTTEKSKSTTSKTSRYKPIRLTPKNILNIMDFWKFRMVRDDRKAEDFLNATIYVKNLNNTSDSSDPYNEIQTNKYFYFKLFETFFNILGRVNRYFEEQKNSTMFAGEDNLIGDDTDQNKPEVDLEKMEIKEKRNEKEEKKMEVKELNRKPRSMYRVKSIKNNYKTEAPVLYFTVSWEDATKVL